MKEYGKKEYEDFRKGIKVVAFDADDTLWDNQNHYMTAESVFCKELSEYGDREKLSQELFEVETGNMECLGYGAKAFTISMMETALKISRGNLSGEKLGRILSAGKNLLGIPATPLPGVTDTLARLHASGKYTLVLFTKGDMLDQQNKLKRSGLEKYFDLTDIVTNKTLKEYADLCAKTGITPEELLMIGNSFKSDIVPVLELGGKAVHIPFEVTWLHEHAEEFEHERLIRAADISIVRDILL